MASQDYADWNQALSRFIEPLEKRFPQHAYQEEVQGWKDKVALVRAERRAEILDKSTIASLARPDGPSEELYLKTRERAAGPIKAGNLPLVAGHWMRFAEALSPLLDKDKDARGWHLLAEKRVRQAREEWLAQARPIAEKKAFWLKARQIGSPTDEEEARTALQKALKESRDWATTNAEDFPVEPEFVTRLPEPLGPPSKPM